MHRAARARDAGSTPAVQVIRLTLDGERRPYGQQVAHASAVDLADSRSSPRSRGRRLETTAVRYGRLRAGSRHVSSPGALGHTEPAQKHAATCGDARAGFKYGAGEGAGVLNCVECGCSELGNCWVAMRCDGPDPESGAPVSGVGFYRTPCAAGELGCRPDVANDVGVSGNGALGGRC